MIDGLIGIGVVLVAAAMLVLYGACRVAGAASRAEEEWTDAQRFQVIQGGKTLTR